MQYSHGICAATASPTRSFILGGSAVIGFTASPLKSIHAPGSARSGTSLKKPGTNPNVFWMSPRAASASDVAAAAAPGAAAAAPRVRVRINIGILRALVMDLPPVWNVGKLSLGDC